MEAGHHEVETEEMKFAGNLRTLIAVESFERQQPFMVFVAVLKILNNQEGARAQDCDPKIADQLRAKLSPE